MKKQKARKRSSKTKRNWMDQIAQHWKQRLAGYKRGRLTEYGEGERDMLALCLKEMRRKRV